MFEKIIVAAKDDDWDFVDKHLPAFYNNYQAYKWAASEIKSSNNPSLVDLAASILAETSYRITADDVVALTGVFEHQEDEWEFARFRAACGLVKYDNKDTSVIDTLLDFTRHEEEDLRPIANEYLSVLSEKDIQDYCSQVGYTAETGSDEPSHKYDAHFHERTILKTLDGSIRIKLDVGEISLKPGNFVLVREKETHAAIVGPKGWKFFAAYSPQDSKRYPGRH